MRPEINIVNRQPNCRLIRCSPLDAMPSVCRNAHEVPGKHVHRLISILEPELSDAAGDALSAQIATLGEDGSPQDTASGDGYAQV